MLEQYLTPELVQGVIVFSVAFLVTLATVPLTRWIAATIGAIDYPSNRRVNDHPVPRCGGIALFVGFLAGCLTLYVGVAFFGWRITDLYIVKGIQYPTLLMAISITFIVGHIDDLPVKAAHAFQVVIMEDDKFFVSGQSYIQLDSVVMVHGPPKSSQ
jgi:UDP-N-acetylmuramyl pentapeptide phosphotransferase/UDP-N-acetylglucosamine-1-phosphate transferase